MIIVNGKKHLRHCDNHIKSFIYETDLIPIIINKIKDSNFYDIIIRIFIIVNIKLLNNSIEIIQDTNYGIHHSGNQNIFLDFTEETKEINIVDLLFPVEMGL